MKKILETTPLFVFLLPLFFVLHGYVENLGYIRIEEALLLAGTYVAGAGIIFLLCLALFKRLAKAALAAVFFLAFYFFFGSLDDFLKAHAHPLSKYSILLPAFLLAATALIIFLRRSSRPFRRTFLLLNSMFLCYILIDGAEVFLKPGRLLQLTRSPIRAIRTRSSPTSIFCFSMPIRVLARWINNTIIITGNSTVS